MNTLSRALSLLHTHIQTHTQVASSLMDADGDVNLMNDHKLTPLHMAFMGGHHDCVKLLMQVPYTHASMQAHICVLAHICTRTDTRT